VSVMGKSFVSIMRVAPKALTELKASVMGYKFDRSREFIPGYKVGRGHWRSVAPKALTECSERQGYNIFNCVQMSALPTEAERRWVSGCNGRYEFVLCAGAKVGGRSDEPERSGAWRSKIPPWRGKNRDKQLTFIVCVRLRFLFLFRIEPTA
jgi:hypothetical protein